MINDQASPAFSAHRLPSNSYPPPLLAMVYFHGKSPENNQVSSQLTQLTQLGKRVE